MLIPHGMLLLVADDGRSRVLRNRGTEPAPTNLVAPSRMLGVLRSSRPRLEKILGEIDKDWIHLTSGGIADVFQQRC